MNIDSPALKVHVINAGYGESIVLELPDGKFGVVDCYAPNLDNPDTNPTRKLLLELGVSELEFVCLTHPHRDHFRGMSHLLEQFDVKRFWRFGAMSREHLVNLITFLKADARERSDEKDLESANDLHRTFQLVASNAKGKNLEIWHVSDIKPLYPMPSASSGATSTGHVEITGISPSSDRVERYHDSLSKCFDDSGALREKAPKLSHNDVSVALLVRFGSSTVLLCGDVEKENWQTTLTRVTPANLAANAVKVAHHGSSTGYTDDLWSILCDGKETIAVITPSLQHKLPTQNAVDHIKAHANAVVTTCKDAILFDSSTDYDIWDDYPMAVNLALRLNLKSFRANRSRDYGICSLTLTETGECSVELLGDADVL